MLWLLGIIIIGFCILNIISSKKVIKGNLCRIGSSAKSVLIWWLVLTAQSVLMKPKSPSLPVGSTNVTPSLEEMCFLPLPRAGHGQGWVSDCGVVASTWIVNCQRRRHPQPLTNIICLLLSGGVLQTSWDEGSALETQPLPLPAGFQGMRDEEQQSKCCRVRMQVCLHWCA